MSLKARIETIIYAAEEPVTLAQLASLFRDEALTARAARLAPAADGSAPSENSAIDTIVDELLPEEAEAAIESDASSAAVPAVAEEKPEAPLAGREGLDSATPEPVPETAAEAEKRAARQRDREVRDEIRRLIDELIADYATADSGLEIREVAGGFRIGTRPEYHDAVRAFIKTLRPPFKLSMQALETLAVIAYKQPVTAPEIGEIRGVDSGGVLGSLVARKLITTAGRKQVVGRPILYKTTKEFLVRFGLKDVNELPSLEEFEKMASELAETEAEGPIAPGEEELPFAQNEIAVVEEAESGRDPGQPAPPMNDPEPEEPEPPISDPPAEPPDPAPTSELDVAEHSGKAHG